MRELLHRIRSVFTLNLFIAWVVILVIKSMFHPTFMEMLLLSIGAGFLAGHLDEKKRLDDERRKK